MNKLFRKKLVMSIKIMMKIDEEFIASSSKSMFAGNRIASSNARVWKLIIDCAISTQPSTVKTMKRVMSEFPRESKLLRTLAQRLVTPA